ncbi:acyl-CoA thioesterase II [Salicola sp. Rm-C-2C1-2]|uniref:acyl-CoA thioesterase n=1 Tax=Salicola sp. Rm-C-2C1-2 TaxID=3141321 RepID=UPI0032E417DB
MEEVTRRLVGLLDVAPLGDDHFSGESDDLGFPNVFGGQVLGQGLMATSRTVEGRLAHSMHAYFLRPGNPHRGIDYEVQRVRDGGTFTVRRVIARQDDREILTAMVSFQVAEEGFEHQFEAPSAPAPEGLTPEQTLREKVRDLIPEERREQMMKERAIDIRPVNRMDPLRPEAGPPCSQSWFRARGPLPDDPVLHRAILAYASDFGLLATSIRPHGVGFSTPGMQVASLDHAIWFHRPLRLDDWLLYDMDSPSASSGRGMNRGTLFNRDGELVASVAQEALIRQRPT